MMIQRSLFGPLVWGVFAVTIALGAPRAAHAFAFQPSVVEFTLADAQLSKTFTVDNTNSSKIAVQIGAHARILDEEGQEQLPTSDHFSVFPKQMILAPGESKVVRVTYVGPKDLVKEAAYRIIAEQMPVDLKSAEAAAGTNLKFLIKYQTSVYVVPARAKAKVLVEATRSVTVDKKGKQLELVLRNDGDAHRILTGARVTLHDKTHGKSLPLPAAMTKELETVNILAGGKRRIRLPWPSEANEDFTAASVEFD